jgi:predicted nucleotidyltransferase
MVTEAMIHQIKEDFNFLREVPEILGLLLYGSQVTGEITQRSDIDICIVAPNQDLYQMFKYITANLRNHIDVYDIRFFEELPLYIQGDIIENGLVIICQDEPTLYEYFFPFRKRWADQKFRLELLAAGP